MAERAHPDDPNFNDLWQFRFRKGFIPWVTRQRSPYRAAFVWRYEWVSQHCQGKDLLDVPCGMGWGTSLISGARSVTGVDLSADAVVEARRRYGERAKFRQGDMSKLDFPDSTFDIVCCLEGIEHVPLDVGAKFLKEGARILRRDGLLLLSSPYCRYKEHSGNPYHIHEYKPEEIHRAVEAHFIIEQAVSKEVDMLTVLYLCCRKTAA